MNNKEITLFFVLHTTCNLERENIGTRTPKLQTRNYAEFPDKITL